MSRDLLKKIMYFVGTIGAFVAGGVFNILSDIILKTASTWLFLSIIIAFGSGICAVFSDSFKEKAKVCIILKSIATGLALCFVIFLVLYLTLVVSAFETKKEVAFGMIITVTSIVLSVITLAAQTADLAFTIQKVKNDE